ncbi:hypothetical protein KDL45_11300 [bacterium]|nr:hypothetical protein [bacterium]
MNQVLSQSEVDALLEAVSSGEIEDDMLDEAALGSIEGSVAQTPGATHKRGEVRNYDLTSQDRIFRGKMPMLDVIHEKFCRDFRGILSMDLGRIADIEQHESRLIKCQEFLNSLPLPSCLSVFKMSPLPGNGVIVVDSQFVFTIVDIFCGGSGKSSYRVEGRDFSSIELGILKRIVASAVKEFGKAWRPVFPCDVEFLRTEINPQFVSIAHPQRGGGVPVEHSGRGRGDGPDEDRLSLLDDRAHPRAPVQHLRRRKRRVGPDVEKRGAQSSVRHVGGTQGRDGTDPDVHRRCVEYEGGGRADHGSF